MSMSQLDANQVIKSVYDATNTALQVNVVASTGSSTNVDIISGDGSGNLATVTAAKALKVDGSAITQPVSAASLPLPTGASTEASLVKLPLAQGSTTSGQSGSLVQGAVTTGNPSYTTAQTSPLSLNVNGQLRTAPGTPPALTVTQAAISVGTSAVRLTVSGSAPASTRLVLAAIPDSASTATFYIGSASVTNSGATRGFQIVAGQPFVANNDAGDYYIVSSTAAQTVLVMEQS